MVEVRFPIEAGAAVRGQIKRAIMAKAFLIPGLHLEVTEDKGFLESVYYFTATGSYANVMELVDWVKAHMEANYDG